jgi:hypothetical protein
MVKCDLWAIFRPLLRRTSLPPAVPLVGLGVPSLFFLWPPIGGVAVYAAGIAVVFIWAFGEFPQLFGSKRSTRRWVGFGLAVAFGSFLPMPIS